MHDHCGYVRGTESKDGDHIDSTMDSHLRRTAAEFSASAPLPTFRASRGFPRAISPNSSGPLIGVGAEAHVHADQKRGVVYKALRGHGSRPTAGIWPQVFYTRSGKLYYHFAPVERPRHRALRLIQQEFRPVQRRPRVGWARN